MTETDGSTFASSSIVRIAEVKDDSAPPNSDDISIPINYKFAMSEPVTPIKKTGSTPC